MSVRYDVTLFDGSSLRHPSADQLMDELAERLQQAIDVHARTAVSVDPDARRALNCIESGIETQTSCETIDFCLRDAIQCFESIRSFSVSVVNR